MDKFRQSGKEALGALGLAVLYLLCWWGSSLVEHSKVTVWGMPLWFALSCVFAPMVFVVLCPLMIRLLYRDFDLEDRP